MAATDWIQEVQTNAANARLTAEAARGEVRVVQQQQREFHAAVQVELQSLREEFGAWRTELLKTLAPKVAKWITYALIPTLGTTFVSVYVAITKSAATTREQAAVVAQTTVEDAKGREQALIRQAIAESRAEWNRQLEAARIEEMRRQVAADRAASMRQSYDGPDARETRRAVSRGSPVYEAEPSEPQQ